VIDKISYFSSNNNSACNISIEQDEGVVFSLHRRPLRTLKKEQTEFRVPLASLGTNTPSKVHHRRVRKIVSQPRETAPVAKMRDRELVFPAFLTMHNFSDEDESEYQSMQCEMSISNEMENELSLDDIKSEITCMHFDIQEKMMYLATKRGHVFIFQ